jgi:transposase
VASSNIAPCIIETGLVSPRRPLSERLWSIIQPLIPKPKINHPLGCHRQRIPDRQVLTGILFVLITGCQWKALDATGICSSSTAHRRFQEWAEADVFRSLWHLGLFECLSQKGLDLGWLSMDGAMTKAPLGGDSTGPNPTDRGKLGVKRSLLVEAMGLPIGLVVDGANRHDSKLVVETLASCPIDLHLVENLCLDKGYDYEHIRIIIEACGINAHIVGRGQEKKAKLAGQKAHRWVVERTHSWLNRNRGILIRWAKKDENYQAQLELACGIIVWRSLLG